MGEKEKNIKINIPESLFCDCEKYSNDVDKFIFDASKELLKKI